MKKVNLIKNLLIIAPWVGGTVMTTACGQKIDPFNLSTWGSKEKKEIINWFFQPPFLWYNTSWSEYTSVIPPNTTSFFDFDLTSAFQQINKSAIVRGINDPLALNWNINWGYGNNRPSGDTQVINVLTTGVSINFFGGGQGFFGSITINIKGYIPPAF